LLGGSSLVFWLVTGHFAYWTLCLQFGHFAHWTLGLRDILPTGHFTYWTVRLLDILPTACLDTSHTDCSLCLHDCQNKIGCV